MPVISASSNTQGEGAAQLLAAQINAASGSPGPRCSPTLCFAPLCSALLGSGVRGGAAPWSVAHCRRARAGTSAAVPLLIIGMRRSASLTCLCTGAKLSPPQAREFLCDATHTHTLTDMHALKHRHVHTPYSTEPLRQKKNQAV